MNNCIKVLYESFKLTEDGKYVSVIKDGHIDFEENEYVSSLPYKDNMEALIRDLMECGFITVKTGEIIPIFRVYSFISNENKEEEKEKPIVVINKNEKWKANNKRKFYRNKHNKKNITLTEEKEKDCSSKDPAPGSESL